MVSWGKPKPRYIVVNAYLSIIIFFVDIQVNHQDAVLAQLKMDASQNFSQISTLTNKVTTLEAENMHMKQLLDSANAQAVKLKGNLSMMNTDYGSMCEKKGTLQQQILLLQEQLGSANVSLTHKVMCCCCHA